MKAYGRTFHPEKSQALVVRDYYYFLKNLYAKVQLVKRAIVT